MAINKEQFIEDIKNMTVLELAELVKAVEEEFGVSAAATAVAAIDLAGERAEALRLQKGTGNATFRTDLIDAVFNLTEEELSQGVHYELYQG